MRRPGGAVLEPLQIASGPGPRSAAAVNSLVHADPRIVAELNGSDPPGGADLILAVLVSYVANPLVIPPLVYGLALAHVGAPAPDVALGSGIGLFFFGAVPLGHVAWMRAQGRIESLQIRDRSKRTEPFLVVLGAGVLAFLTVLGLDVIGRRLLVAMIGCHLLNTGFLFWITSGWKISVHCASVAGAVGTLAFVGNHLPGGVLADAPTGPVILSVGAVLVAVMLWARVRSRAHTVPQAVAGTALGLVAPYAELLAIDVVLGL